MSELAAHWPLDPRVVFLNHGSFGACPTPVLEAQTRLRARLEAQPVQFLARDLEPLLDEARDALARFVGARAEDLVFVPNATTGINTALKSLRFEPGDEILVSDHAYGACRNTCDQVARATGARAVVARVPFPVAGPDEIVQSILSCVSRRTRIAVVDHVTSQTALVLPIARVVRELRAAGVETLVDGAHAPGNVDLDIEAVGAAYYTGNCHKWICAPKAAGFLWVRPDLREGVHPVITSHGFAGPLLGRSRFWREFDWVGTADPTPILCVTEAFAFVGSLLPGGWREVRERNRALALTARVRVIEALGIEPPCPDEMIGSMASLPLPPASGEPAGRHESPLQKQLLEEWRIEIPIIPWPAAPARVVRLSAQLYNTLEQYELLARALGELVPRSLRASS